MPRFVEGHLSAAGLEFAIVVSRFNEIITERLLDGAVDALVRHGAVDDAITVYRVPGSFEVPLMARKLVETGFGGDAIICLGALIRGATPHFDYIASAAAGGIAGTALKGGVPVSFGRVDHRYLGTSPRTRPAARPETKAGKRPFRLWKWRPYIANCEPEEWLEWQHDEEVERPRSSSCMRSRLRTRTWKKFCPVRGPTPSLLRERGNSPGRCFRVFWPVAMKSTPSSGNGVLIGRWSASA